MNNWNKLLVLLDHALGFANRQSSSIKKVWQAFDNKSQEHVVWLEYRVRVGKDKPLELPNKEMNRLRQIATDLANARVSRR
jgi:hypothetical protein